MHTDAIVYTSQTGHTRQYAQMLRQALGLPAYSMEEAVTLLPQGCRVIYLGWLQANYIKGFRKAARHFHIRAVCGVGLCDTGTIVDEVRRASSVPSSIPLFTLQGGIDRGKLHGINKLLISLLTRGLSDQKQRSAQDERILALLTTDGSYVREENLKHVLDWYQTQHT